MTVAKDATADRKNDSNGAPAPFVYPALDHPPNNR
jgi:hypothetical protein